jgi:hypothetical protein
MLSVEGFHFWDPFYFSLILLPLSSGREGGNKMICIVLANSSWGMGWGEVKLTRER